MRVKGYELDTMVQKYHGYENITDMMKGLREELMYSHTKYQLHRESLKLYKAKREKFIKDNNITVLQYKGDNVWGGFIYDNLLELNEFLEVNYIKRLEYLQTDLPKILLTKIKEMKIVSKVNGRYKWTGSRNFQALTNLILKYYVSPKKKSDELVNKHIKQAKLDNTYKSNKREKYIRLAYYETESLLEKAKDENDIYYYESVKYELENYENN